MDVDLHSIAYKRRFLAIFVLMTGFIYMDRVLMSTLGQAIKADLALSDMQLGMLGGLAIAIFYALFAVPAARLAEYHSRVWIVASAVAIWSIMTTLCGLAKTFPQLFIARLGVGIGETGILATQSLVSDMFPPERRASALGIINFGYTLGIVGGAVASGLLVQSWGWRAAFFLLGLPGMALSLLILLVVKEPPRGALDEGSARNDGIPPKFREVVRTAFSKRCFVHVLIGATLVMTIGSGLSQFMHPFFVRRFHLSYANAALLFGAINGLTTGVGFVLGGVLADFLTGRDKRFYGIVPAVSLVLAAPLFAFGFLQADWRVAGPLLALGGMCSSTFFAPTYAVAHNIVTARMRASVTAIVSLGSSLTALAIGPTLAGYMSDRFSTFRLGADFTRLCPGGHAPTGASAKLASDCAQAGAFGTRDALVFFSLLFIWAAIHYLFASKTMRTDLPSTATTVRARPA